MDRSALRGAAIALIAVAFAPWLSAQYGLLLGGMLPFLVLAIFLFVLSSRPESAPKEATA